ncbi:hypothetical protein PSECIP111951_03737 [Pseudoalteromonas holothuriae]|uniref:DUF2914 domain-containing protein n=1 Tax=Pseudoalteromonas holothuriae TaxID=2963714 RepID=A0ABN8UQZ1_9GAMM|nr:DUF2914 domain-containing protein [Pseudoalteromonas sp. CIP111951]CAH9067234.1 hypothetical protein PSECIP111951_03737 [Pseudoalteromonas sp. CIP111951]
MTQRIVIKTAVNRVPQTNAKVSYQWHWRRIFMASSVVLLFAAAVMYGLMNSVNADEIQPEQTSVKPKLLSQVPVQVNSTAISDIIVPLESEQQTEVSQQLEQQFVAKTTQPLMSTNFDGIDQSYLESSDGSERAIDASTDADQDVFDEQKTENVFAEHATITNVALGAQIDSNLVSRAVLTTGVLNREPIDVLKDNLERGKFAEKLFFFTEINNMQNQTVQHLWFHQDQLMAEIPLSISAIRFRTFSSKNIMPSQTGPWRVEVVTEQGQLLAQKSFRIISSAD